MGEMKVLVLFFEQVEQTPHITELQSFHMRRRKNRQRDESIGLFVLGRLIIYNHRGLLLCSFSK